MNINSPSLKLELPVIGNILCHIKGQKDNHTHFYDLGSLEVIFIENTGNDTLYWINDWQSDLEPVKVSSRYVKEFIQKDY